MKKKKKRTVDSVKIREDSQKDSRKILLILITFLTNKNKDSFLSSEPKKKYLV